MMRWLARWFFRLFLAFAVVSLAAYVIDSAVYAMRGSPKSAVAVNRFMGIPLKGNKEEYDYLNTVQTPCAVALFPHSGLDPCWHLRRNPNNWENI